VKKANINSMLVLVLALCAGIGAYADVYTGTDFDHDTPGTCIDAYSSRWWITSMLPGGVGLVTNAVVTQGSPKGGNYLSLDLQERLQRTIIERAAYPDGGYYASNVATRVTGEDPYDGLYVDTTVRFTVGEGEAAPADGDKLLLSFRAFEDAEGKSSTNLSITAGRYCGKAVESHQYVVENCEVRPGEWCRLTLRAVPNVLVENLGQCYPAFVVYIDGKPVSATPESYDIGQLPRNDRFTPEARLLISRRQLFPWYVDPVKDNALGLSGMVFSGKGAVDDIRYSSHAEDYSFATVDSVFTLKADRGVASLECVVSNATQELYRETLVGGQSVDYAIGQDACATVTVNNVVYETELGFAGSAWLAEGDYCRVEENRFVFAGPDKDFANPIGHVTAARDFIGIVPVGTGNFETFKAAKDEARKRGSNTLVLTDDLTIGVIGDNGKLTIESGDDFILDLNGHILRGCVPVSPTIYQTGGGLRIVDSVGGGAVQPPAGGTVAVKSECKGVAPVLDIEAGRYDGAVVMDGPVDPVTGESHLGICRIGGGSFTNYNGRQTFYLDQYITNSMAYYACSDGYWQLSREDGHIWCGKGADKGWNTAANWRNGKVPGEDDIAIFPPTDTPWRVNYDGDNGEILTRNYLMDGDIHMTGTAEFSQLTFSGEGIFHGTGTMVYTGQLPTRPRIADDWAGTVKLTGIGGNVILGNLAHWGVAGSTVEFCGVQGYVKDTVSRSLPYGLKLTDLVSEDGATTNVAWRNETGYTGSTISFARLSGSGTFESPVNLRTINQVFQFHDTADFTGRLSVQGKRVLLGNGSVARTTPAGSVTFGNGATVRSGLGWTSTTARFGETLNVRGVTNDVLIAYTGSAKPQVDAVRVFLFDSFDRTNECRLVAIDGRIIVTNGLSETQVQLNLNGRTVSAEAADREQLREGSTLTLPDVPAVALSGNDVLVNGEVRLSVSDYYRLCADPADPLKYVVRLNEAAIVPEVAEIAVEPGENGVVLIAVANARPGLSYALQSIDSLAEEWPAPQADDWYQPDDDGYLVFEDQPPAGASRFYRVIVTDKPGVVK